jgi:anthranilate phosphoribosyltransferase
MVRYCFVICYFEYLNIMSHTEISSSVAACMLGPASNAQISAFLTSLAMRLDIQHSPSVLIACRNLLLSHALPFHVSPADSIAVDIVGTGGDGYDTFNVSTAASMVVRAVAKSTNFNLVVAKHGNRSSSGKCGSADFIEALGASLSVTAAQRAMDQTGFAFLFAPSFHPAMLAVKSVRKVWIGSIFVKESILNCLVVFYRISKFERFSI